MWTRWHIHSWFCFTCTVWPCRVWTAHMYWIEIIEGVLQYTIGSRWKKKCNIYIFFFHISWWMHFFDIFPWQQCAGQQRFSYKVICLSCTIYHAFIKYVLQKMSQYYKKKCIFWIKKPFVFVIVTSCYINYYRQTVNEKK